METPRTVIDVRIIIRGEIDGRLARVFNGLSVRSDRGVTIVSGWMADETQIHGLLDTIRGFGLRIVSANWHDVQEAG